MSDTSREQYRQLAQASYERQMGLLREASGQIEEAGSLDDVKMSIPVVSIEDQRVKRLVIGLGGPTHGYIVFFTSDGVDWEPVDGFYFYHDSPHPTQTFWLESEQLEQVIATYSLDMME